MPSSHAPSDQVVLPISRPSLRGGSRPTLTDRFLAFDAEHPYVYRALERMTKLDKPKTAGRPENKNNNKVEADDAALLRAELKRRLAWLRAEPGLQPKRGCGGD